MYETRYSGIQRRIIYNIDTYIHYIHTHTRYIQQYICFILNTRSVMTYICTVYTVHLLKAETKNSKGNSQHFSVSYLPCIR